MSVVHYTADFAEAFDNVRVELLGKDAKFVLLREEGSTHAFDQVQSPIEGGWYPEYSKFYGNTTFHLADVSGTTAKNVRNATHVMMIDTVLEATNNLLFEMKAETAPPDMTTPWWRIRAEQLSRKYFPPEEV